MKKYQISKIKNQKFLISCYLLLVSCLLFLVASSPALAADASSSSSLIDKINQIKKEVASRAAQIKQEVNKKLQNKAFAGTILQKDAASLILATDKGQKTVNINEYTEYDNKASSKKAVNGLRDLSKDDFVAALGDVDENSVMTAKKLIRVNPPQNTRPVWGEVLSIASPNINIKAKDGKNTTLQTDKDTSFQDIDGDTTFVNIKAGNNLIAVGSEIRESTMSGTLSPAQMSARFVYLLVSNGKKPTPTPKKIVN